MCTQGAENGAFIQPEGLHQTCLICPHEIFCPRFFSRHARLADSTKSDKCGQTLEEPANTKFHEHSFSNSRTAEHTQISTLLQPLCLPTCQKAAFRTNPVTPAEHNTGRLTNSRLELSYLLSGASVNLKAGPQQQADRHKGLCCPRSHVK